MLVMKMKKIHLTSYKLEKLHNNPKIEKKMKNNSLKFLELNIMNLKMF